MQTPQTLEIVSSFSSRESSRGGGSLPKKIFFADLFLRSSIFTRLFFFFF